jgi:hypothetical protein
MWWWRAPARVLIAADADVALLSSAAALRRLGARITRYDSEAGTLEAQLPPAATVRVRTVAAEDGVTQVHLEGDGAARQVMRRFRAALGA